MRAPVLLLLVMLLAPSAQAHVLNLPPDLQGVQFQRDVVITTHEKVAQMDLVLKPDPFSHLLRYQLDPPHGGIREQYRPSAASLVDSFTVTFNFTRVIQYQDTNHDLVYDSAIDIPLRVWPWSDGAWKVDAARSVNINGVPGKSIAWDGKLPNGPRINFTAASTGFVFGDEGARGAPQDMIVYLDLREFPSRGTGHLFSMEGTVTVDGSTTVREAVVANRNLTTGLFVEGPNRLASLSWGGEAVLDGLEKSLEATLGKAVDNPDGTRTYPFGIHMPAFNQHARFVLITGMQYKTPERGTPGFEAWSLLLVAVMLIAARHGRRPRA